MLYYNPHPPFDSDEELEKIIRLRSEHLRILSIGANRTLSPEETALSKQIETELDSLAESSVWTS